VAFSPQAWGCTDVEPQKLMIVDVFPTGVGVYRRSRRHLIERYRFPHRRGGVPTYDYMEKMVAKFSPQAWGCTEPHGHVAGLRIVFPTGVGVYRNG